MRLAPPLTTLSLATAVAVTLLAATSAVAQSATLINPTGGDRAEVTLLPGISAKGTQPGAVAVQCEGKSIPAQAGEIDGQAGVWVWAEIPSGHAQQYEVGNGSPLKQSLVSVKKEGDALVLQSDLCGVRVPAASSGDEPPPPVLSVLSGGKWVGAGEWRSPRKLKRFSAEVVTEGPLFATVKLRYEFEGMAGLYQNVPSFADVLVIVYAGERHAEIRERHEMSRGDYWAFDAAAGWGPRHAICIPHSGGFGRPDLGPWPPNSLKTGQTRMGNTLLNLMPRWTQAYDEGWFFAAHDGKNAVGAMVVRAGDWHWPHNNMIQAKVKETGDYAGLLCPTWRGRRVWFLCAGPSDTWAGAEERGGAKSYVTRHAFQPLTKLNNEYELTWPGLDGLTKNVGGFSGQDFFSSGMNPTGGIRGAGRAAVRSAGRQGNLSELTRVQVLFDNDAYGSYWNYWSPENPNFYTDYIRVPVALTTQLKKHPDFKEYAKLAEQKFRADLYHSVTLPGGAGQECPGYTSHAMHAWQDLAPICKEHLGFDATRWPRFKAGASFLLHVSQPIGGGQRRCHPGGDTHPLGPDVNALANEFGVKEDLGKFVSEELPGFGAVLRNKPGTGEETYFAFKSGPNRGHFHGDQLSFHYCANSKPLVIDHMCSYSPRAGGEHMHNRIAFHTDKAPFANMDGYERLIAIKTSPEVDIAMGQVESERLRFTEAYPPEGWDVDLPQETFETPLVYRRTVVLVKATDVKGLGEDYFVIRDQFAGPTVKATYCLHVLSDRIDQKENTFTFDRLTLFAAKPQQFQFSRHDWSHERKDKKSGAVYIREATIGPRLTIAGDSGEFITVLYPSTKPPAMEAIEGGVSVGDDEIVFAGGIDEAADEDYVTVRRGGSELAGLSGREIDLDRFQGEVGLFVPDAGYPFGEIPDWLIKQRSAVPDWAPDWARQARWHEQK